MRSRSNPADPFAAAHDAAFAQLSDAVARLDEAAPVVVIDGRSGGGKTTLARRLADSWPRPGRRPQLVALDSFYPGWDGLADATRLTREWLLEPHHRGEEGAWRRYDWERQEYAEQHAVDPVAPLIVEGAGALSVQARALIDLAVWIDAPKASRRRRALERDGDAYAPHWDRWAAQEEAHLARTDPRRLADLTFDLP